MISCTSNLHVTICGDCWFGEHGKFDRRQKEKGTSCKIDESKLGAKKNVYLSTSGSIIYIELSEVSIKSCFSNIILLRLSVCFRFQYSPCFVENQ